jgi:hypothetical protein
MAFEFMRSGSKFFEVNHTKLAHFVPLDVWAALHALEDGVAPQLPLQISSWKLRERLDTCHNSHFTGSGVSFGSQKLSMRFSDTRRKTKLAVIGNVD